MMLVLGLVLVLDITSTSYKVNMCIYVCFDIRHSVVLILYYIECMPGVIVYPEHFMSFPSSIRNHWLINDESHVSHENRQG